MLEQSHSFGGRALDRYIYDFETAEVPTEAAPAPDGGGHTEHATDGVAETAAADTPALEQGEPQAPAALTLEEAQRVADERFQANLDRLADEQRQAQQRQTGEDTAQQRLARITEAFELVGLDPDDLKGWLQGDLGLESLQQAAQNQQQQEALRWVDQQLTTLGQGAYQDLLGPELGGVSALTDPDGEPLGLDTATVLDQNRAAVLAAANAVQAQAQAAGQQVDAAQALSEGARLVKERDEVLIKIGEARYVQRLNGAGNAPRSIATGSSGAEGAPLAKDERELVRALYR